MAKPTTLFEFYTSIGSALPPISTRAVFYENYGLGSAASYTGTAAQNTALAVMIAPSGLNSITANDLEIASSARWLS